MNLKNYILFSSILFVGNVSAQVLISDADYTGTNACDCATTFSDAGTPNFYDTGGNGAGYGNNENEVFTFCPNNTGSKSVLVIATNIGFTWDVDGSDTLYVYDGPTTSSPLLVAANSITHPTGINSNITTASWSNPSGCLTLQFVSDASNTGNGWDASISCSNPWQPMEIHLDALIGAGEALGQGDNNDDFTNQMITGPLADTGYVNVCLGDSIKFVNTTEYPYEPGGSLHNGIVGGYNQSNPGNHTTTWTFSDGTVATGDEVWFTPTARTGYFVTMKVTDSKSQYVELLAKVRVSTIPSFETCEVIDPSICLGQTTTLIGGITPGDTAGVDATGSAFQIQGSYGAQTFLPDGSGQNYDSDIDITGFPTGTLFQNTNDLEKLCVSIEHSFLGDLEMELTCPNGQSVVIFDAYDAIWGPELSPGGFNGSGTFLGGANDDGTIAIGVCEEYCFSNLPSAGPAWSTSTATTSVGPPNYPSAGNMITPGMYNPAESFISGLANCPLNGTWTITVRDNQTIDNGYICEWGLFFDATLNPNNETYSPTIVNEDWLSDPTILLGTNDTAVIVSPNQVGNYDYTFEVEDNFGCSYDTTVTVNVIDGPSILPDNSTCDDQYAFTNTYVPNVNGVSGGHWFYDGPGNVTFSPSNTFINPTITPSGNGPYDIYFTDNVCHDTLMSTIFFAEMPSAEIYGRDSICLNDTAQFYTTLKPGEDCYWTNSNGEIISYDTVAIGLTSGEYNLTVSNFCGTSTASIELVVQPCKVPNVITPNGTLGQNDTFYTKYAEVYDDVNLTIYNRWGRVVYKTESYDNTWRGEKTNGKDLHGGDRKSVV